MRPGLSHTTILLVGLGNPIMGDDAVGIHVVRMLKDRNRGRADLEFKELSLGGLGLVEEILGYERVFIIDSVASTGTVGKICELSPEHFKGTEYASSPHSTNFATALELFKRFENSAVPHTIRIFTIDITPEFIFREALSPSVQRAAFELAELVGNEIEQIRN
ncbi:MAG: hydrogenase maturation protease [Candidatus Bathyarchaeia archaeon]